MTTDMQLELHMTIGDHPYIRSANDWEGGSRKYPVFMTFSTDSIYSDIVGDGSKNVQDYADVIAIWIVPCQDAITVIYDNFVLQHCRLAKKSEMCLAFNNSQVQILYMVKS